MAQEPQTSQQKQDSWGLQRWGNQVEASQRDNNKAQQDKR